MKRNNILAKKKQMKTTTFLMTLLISVALISSGAVTAISVNMNEEENLTIGVDLGGETAPTNAGEVEDAEGEGASEIMDVLDKTYYYSGSTRSNVVWDNDMTQTGGLIRAEIEGTTFESRIADDFRFDAETVVDDVHWIGGHWSPYGAVDVDWIIEFYEDDGSDNYPTDTPIAGPYTIPYADITSVPAGSYFVMSCDIPSTTFAGGQKYWIAIHADGSESAPYAGWAFHPWYYVYWEGMLVWKSPYFGMPDWTTIADYGYPPTDMCFQLTNKPEHDVYADAIIAPTDISAFCPCTAVEATFGNAGLNDETDVPVSVEIRSYQTHDFEFNDPVFVFWEMFPWGNIWFPSMIEAAYPGYVTPHTPPFMAELDSGLTGPGGADLVSIPIDISEKCHPMLSFYMWHDEYGSDDFISVYANDGGGWIDIGGPFYRLCCPGCPQGWLEHTLDLSAFTGAVQITFEGNCDSNAGAYELMIDTVNVYDQEYYEEDEVDIDVGQTVTVEFPEWCPCHWQDPAFANDFFDIEVVACTDLDTDEIPANDCLSEVATMYMPFEHDIAAISIDEPVGNTVPIDTFEMCGTIKNVGQYEECCFSVYMTVEEVIYGATVDLFSEDFESTGPYTMPPGWTEDDPNNNWETYYNWYIPTGGNYDLEFYYYPSYLGTYRAITPAIDTTGYPEVIIDFDHYLSHWSGPYTLSVETSTTGLPGSFTPIPDLTFVNPTGWSATHETATTTQDTGGPLYLAFTFSGTPYNLNYWDIDNIVVSGQSVTYLPPEYEDSYCIDDIDVCEEIQICFDDWTPATPYPDCGEITYRICLETAMCDPMDQNPANDIVCEYITVEFWHDVAINEITNPADDDRVDWIQYTDETPENALGLTGPGTICEAIKLTPAELGTYTNHEITKIRVYKGYPGYTYIHDYEVWMYTGAQPTDPDDGTVVATGTSPLANGWFEIDTVGYGFDPSDTVWVGVTWDHPMASTFPCGMDDSVYIPGQSSWFIYDVGSGWAGWMEYGPYSMMIGAGVEVAGGPPSIDLYIPCGEQDFCATFENLGTFDEPGCIIDWTLYEWNTDPENPTYVTGGSEPIDLDIGEVLEDYCFGSYNFVDEGIYELVVEIIAPTVDCYTDNNGPLDIALGVDCCPPETTFVLDPEQPDGENNWFISEITVTVDAVDCCDPPHDGSGVKEIKYKVNGVEGTISGDHGTIMLEDDGVHLVELWAIDNAGNEEAEHHTFEVAIDTGDPSIDLIYEAYEEDDGWHVDFTALASDDTSGIDKVEFYIGSSLEGTLTEAPFVWSIAWEEGYETETFKATAYDNAGNSASDTVDGSIIEAVSALQAQSVPVWLVQQQANSLVRL